MKKNFKVKIDPILDDELKLYDPFTAAAAGISLTGRRGALGSSSESRGGGDIFLEKGGRWRMKIEQVMGLFISQFFYNTGFGKIEMKQVGKLFFD